MKKVKAILGLFILLSAFYVPTGSATNEALNVPSPEACSGFVTEVEENATILDTTNPYTVLNSTPLDERYETEGTKSLDILVFADEEARAEEHYLEPHGITLGWEDYAVWQIERGDEALVALFGIDIRIRGLLTWDSPDRQDDFSQLYYEFDEQKKSYKRTEYDGHIIDAIVGITAQKTPAYDAYGLAHADWNAVLLRWTVYWKDDNLVQTEISHLFRVHDHEEDENVWCIMSDWDEALVAIWEDGYFYGFYVNVDRTFLTHDYCSECFDIMDSNKQRYRYDVAVTNVTPTLPYGATEVYPGWKVDILVTVENQDDFYETFDVHVTAGGFDIYIPKTVELRPNQTKTLTFTWDTTGFESGYYTIIAQADSVPGEIDTSDNENIDGTKRIRMIGDANDDGVVNHDDTVILIAAYGSKYGDPNYNWRADFDGDGDVDDNDAAYVPIIHDVAVTSVTAFPTFVRVGESVTITVQAENQGTYTETFDVTAYYGGTAIDTQTVTNLAAGGSTTLTFTWNTAGVSPETYTIKAVADMVPDETDTADNTRIDGTVTVEYYDVEYEVTSTFYSFFDYNSNVYGPYGLTPAEIHDIYWGRWNIISGDTLAGQPAYPVVYTDDSSVYYTVCRLHVTGRSLGYLYIDTLGSEGGSGLLPRNLMGGEEAGVTGGTASIDWQLKHIDLERAAELDEKYDIVPPLASWYDGWISEWTLTIRMDRSAARKLLGITEADYNDFSSWWAGHETAVEGAWEDWVDHEGNTRLDVWNFYGRGPVDAFFLDINCIHVPTAGEDYVELTLDSAWWGMECLTARWLRYAFLPGYEGWYTDLHLSAIIGPETTDLELDTAVDRAMYMWSEGSIPTTDDLYPQMSAWVWEPRLGDNSVHPGHPSAMLPYSGKTYYSVGPGHEDYGEYIDYDYTPSAWNLVADEKLIFDFSNTRQQYQAGNKVWVYTQMTWDPATQSPMDTIRKDYGYLILGYIEPWPETLYDPLNPNYYGYNPTMMRYNDTLATLTFTGPFNFTDWSHSTIYDEWCGVDHPEGVWDPPLLPRGCPYINFRVMWGPGDITGNEPIGSTWSDTATVNMDDIDKVLLNSGATTRGDAAYNPQADINLYQIEVGGQVVSEFWGDGLVDVSDLLAIVPYYGNDYVDP